MHDWEPSHLVVIVVRCEASGREPPTPECMALSLAYVGEVSINRRRNPLRSGVYTTWSCGNRIGANTTGFVSEIVQPNGKSSDFHTLCNAMEGSLRDGDGGTPPEHSSGALAPAATSPPTASTEGNSTIWSTGTTGATASTNDAMFP
ncbi:hypothetical protein DQ04_10981010 [Trypanosoma grayi]|uniref:hypothetical protein n=1 Tax=Trypanosoma grayi TaxID=71804 RepID=UPI0004F421D8|nr:hypothetical protein DQ04_10981010 [Trypanosoma grayi]KEG07083.1 hypothetical protein DQ04_10981010 [Trypanosoma grayi]